MPTASQSLLITTSQIPQAILRAANRALEGDRTETTGHLQVVRLLAEGGYNNVWLVSYSPNTTLETRPAKDQVISKSKNLVLRIPKEDSLLPYQIQNEVGFLRFISRHFPTGVPVPTVHGFCHESAVTGQQRAFIIEELIPGQPLSSGWDSYGECEKHAVAEQIAEIIVKLGQTTFKQIGGLTQEDGTIGPTVEGSKIFKGRAKFHRQDCYDIGPYKSTKEYVISCYDKEIHYYANASNSDIDQDLFEGEVSKDEFLNQLRQKRSSISLSIDDTVFPTDEPFVLVHGDLHGRNIMATKDGRVSGILDWESAGSYPLSELLGGGSVDVVEPVDERTEHENDRWGDIIRDLVGQVCRRRAWPDDHVGWLLGPGNRELQKARVEMFPPMMD